MNPTIRMTNSSVSHQNQEREDKVLYSTYEVELESDDENDHNAVGRVKQDRKRHDVASWRPPSTTHRRWGGRRNRPHNSTMDNNMTNCGDERPECIDDDSDDEHDTNGYRNDDEDSGDESCESDASSEVISSSSTDVSSGNSTHDDLSTIREETTLDLNDDLTASTMDTKSMILDGVAENGQDGCRDKMNEKRMNATPQSVIRTISPTPTKAG